MIKVFKLMHNYDDVDRRQFFQTAGEESVSGYQTIFWCIEYIIN